MRCIMAESPRRQKLSPVTCHCTVATLKPVLQKRTALHDAPHERLATPDEHGMVSPEFRQRREDQQEPLCRVPVRVGHGSPLAEWA